MGILLAFILLCLILYAVLVSQGLFYLTRWVIMDLAGFDVSLKTIWLLINLALWLLACRFIYALLLDSRGGTPNTEGVWKFYLVLNSILFLIVFLWGYKSK
ncbi:MAG: hypothetical protein IPN29_06415 [Saprospiraceae bacterium]|nr:hypothetical protein [Saprospiraceae bacterium]